MNAQDNIDAALDSVLRASGSALRNYTMPATLEKMREAMRKVMSDSYIAGSNDYAKALRASGQINPRVGGSIPSPATIYQGLAAMRAFFVS